MKVLLILVFTLSTSFVFARGDADQEITVCGHYAISAKLVCDTPPKCYLDIYPGKLSNIKVNITKTPYSLSYFSGVDVNIKVRIYTKGSVVKGEIISRPVRQISALKEVGRKLIKKDICGTI